MKIAKVDYGTLLSQAWGLFKKEWAFFIIAMLTMAVIEGLGEYLGGEDSPLLGGSGLIAVLLLFVIKTVLQVGLYRETIGYTRGKKPAIENIFKGYKPMESLIHYILVMIIYIIAVVIGLILLIIPGIIIAVRFSFAPYLVIDKKLTAIDALKESARITKGNFWSVVAVSAIMIGITILGLLALIVGLFVAIPVASIFFTLFYKYLVDAHGEQVAQKEIVPEINPAQAGYTDVN